MSRRGEVTLVGSKAFGDRGVEQMPGAGHGTRPHPAPFPRTSPGWMSDGLCAQVDPDAWFPPKGGNSTEAKAVCRRCPVIEQCLAHALDLVRAVGSEQTLGVWGGTTESERSILVRDERRAA